MSLELLPDQVRKLLAGRDVREVPMFGGISFMVDDRMVASARGNGDLLLRIDPDLHDQLLDQPGAKPAMMNADRPMGDNWLAVSGDSLNGRTLKKWLGHALDYHASQS